MKKPAKAAKAKDFTSLERSHDGEAALCAHRPSFGHPDVNEK